MRDGWITLGVIGATVAISATSASGATMTFAGINDDPAAYVYSEDGITVSGNGNLGIYGSGALHLDDFGTSAPSRAVFTMDSAFDAISFDIAGSFLMTICKVSDPSKCKTPTYKNVLVEGFVGAQSVASLVFDMSKTSGTVQLGSMFSGLTSLAISVVIPPHLMPFQPPKGGKVVSCALPCSHFDIDNVVLAPVPLPATAPLLAGALALAGAGFALRRRARA